MRISTGGRRVWRICATSLLAVGITTFVVSQAYGASNNASTTATSTTSSTTTTTSADTTAGAAPTDPGAAVASSSFVTVGPQFGGFNLSLTLGSSAASLQGGDASSSSQDVYLGELGADLKLSSSATNALTADSGTGTTSKTGGTGNTEAVTASASPESASATTAPLSESLPGLLQVIGKATASVSYTAGKVQTADAQAVVQLSLGDGLVTLNGLTWSASQHLGTPSVNSGSFSVASISVGSTKLPTLTQAELNSAVSLANNALAVLGLTIFLPAVTTDALTGAITVSGLDLRLTGTKTTNAVLEPLLAEEPQIEKDLDGAIASTGELATLAGSGELVGDVMLGVLAGAGQVNLILGGASAGSSAAPAGYQFGSGGSSSSDTYTGSTFLPSTGSNFGSSFGVPTSPTATSGTSTTLPAKTAAEAAGSAPVAMHCETTSPSGRPGCWRSVGTDIAAGLLIGGAALFAVDFRQSRRRRFLRPKETPL
jgi:hypothetical protein